MMGMFPLSLALVVLALWPSHARPLQTDTLNEFIGLLRALDSPDGQLAEERGLERLPEEAGLIEDIPDKRDLPRLGVLVDRPLPLKGGDSRKIMDSSRYRFSFPLTNLRG